MTKYAYTGRIEDMNKTFVVAIAVAAVGIIGTIVPNIFRDDLVDFYCAPGATFLWMHLPKPYCGSIVLGVHMAIAAVVLVAIFVLLPFFVYKKGEIRRQSKSTKAMIREELAKEMALTQAPMDGEFQELLIHNNEAETIFVNHAYLVGEYSNKRRLLSFTDKVPIRRGVPHPMRFITDSDKENFEIVYNDNGERRLITFKKNETHHFKIKIVYDSTQDDKSKSDWFDITVNHISYRKYEINIARGKEK